MALGKSANREAGGADDCQQVDAGSVVPKKTTFTASREITIESRRVRMMDLLKTGQYTQQEVADILGVSLATVAKDKRMILDDWRENYLASVEEIVMVEAMRLNDAIADINEKIEQIEDNPNWFDKNEETWKLSVPQYDLLNKLYNTRLAYLRQLHKVLGIEKVADTNIAIYNDNRASDGNREHLITILREKGISNVSDDDSKTIDGNSRVLTDDADDETD